MIEMLVVVTLVCMAMPVYVYAGYPLLLWLLTRQRPPAAPELDEPPPSVTLVVSCFNEAAVIADKLDNALKTDYPADRFGVVVVSDGSDDGTDDIVHSFASRGVRLVRQEGRLGKTMGLNRALETIDSDIVVFSDANALYEPQAIRRLVAHFSDGQVGYVVGAALYTDSEAGGSAHNENLYWRYELAIKSMESRLHSVVGGDGAIYAIRRTLWEPLQQRDINDFVNPLQIIAKGYRGLFEPTASCFEETAGSYDREIARKERIVNRSIRGLMRVKSVMNPARSGVFAFEVISHKLLRWLIPLFMAVGVAGSTVLAATGMGFFQLVTAGSLVMILLALQGQRTPEKHTLPPWLSLPYYFVMVNLYAVKGTLKALRGETQVTWNSARPSGSPTGNASDQSTAVSGWWWLVVGVMIVGLGLGYV
ncbi:glycosyl transferase family 2 [Tamilnaduibacter salinus]|uniref:Glycosyl transferase family 2 n=1 Tax=Tamilnaduibacter salinus TaxID=1484056 RepID=A0A2A2I7M3_9GAMM|nr:glycosyltransferase family 2 protein [Tamilnaduibacter salinus]PAV27043.1 glycosyl transferase family 2 [Tamilnaduibacter salinus]